MITEVCQYLKNWFELKKIHGKFVIENGYINNVGLLDGQYYRVIGSALNDGVHRYPDALRDETFEGSVWTMGIPQAVLDLVSEIEAWRAKYETVDSTAMSPFQSESFGGYSYSKGSTSNGSTNPGWQSVFASRLNPWRKI